MTARGADGGIRHLFRIMGAAPGRPRRIVLMSAMAALAAGCNATTGSDEGFEHAGSDAPVAAPEVADYHVGEPYEVAGRWYHPKEEPGYDSVGKASWYGQDFHGRRTASGEVYDMNALSAAHPTLPIPTYARVTNLDNDRSVVVRINDRGPFAHDREIDVSRRAAQLLDFTGNGTADVRVQYVGAAPRDGEKGWLTTTVRQDGDSATPTMIASRDVGTGAPEADGEAADPAPMPNARPMAGGASSRAGGDGARTALGLAPGFAPEPRTNVVAETFALFDSDGREHAGRAEYR